MPDTLSVPPQETWKREELFVSASACTSLEGGDRSIVLDHSGVSIGAFTSKTMRALFRITLPSGSVGFAFTVKRTAPSPSGAVLFGGRKPAAASSVGCKVAGSSEVKRHVTTPEVLLSAPETRTM